MDSVQFYQPPTTASLRSDGRPTVSKLHVPTAYGKGKKASESLQDFDLIEFLDMNGPPPKEYTDPLHMPAPNLCTEKDARGPSNIADTEGGHEHDDTLPSLEELLFGAGEVPESQRAGSSIEHGVGKSDGAFEHPTLEGCDNASTSGPRQGGDQGGDINDSSSIHSRSDDSTSKEQVGKQCSLSTPPTSLAGPEAGCFILYEKIENFISDSPSPLLDTPLSLTHDTQTCFNTTEPYHSGKGKEKGGKGTSYSTHNIIPHTLRSPIATVSPTYFTDAAPETTTGATDTRHSSKRKAGSAGLDGGGKSGHRLEKFRRADTITIDDADDTDDDLNEVEFARIRSQPKPVFKWPASPRNFQRRENTTSSNRSSEVGGSQGDPLVVEDDEEKTGETGGSTRATNMESEIGNVHLKSSHPREQPKTHGCMSPATTTEPTISPIDRPIPPSVALPQDRGTLAAHGGDHGATATVDLLGVAATPLSHEQPQDQRGSALDEEEWEIVRIVGKRRREKGYEYKVCWKKTWLLERELGNAQELLREFKVKRQAQRGGKRGRPARADKGR